MIRDEDITRLASAIRKAAAEHGVPNRFSPGEIATYYGGPNAMTAGHIGRRCLDRLRREAPQVVAYRDRHFELSN